MRCFISNSNKACFNLATEEFFLKNSNDDFFILYINESSVIVGKHQNILSEINLRYVMENGIKLARRISGGGAVFHDLSNLNFSFIQNCQNKDKINFQYFINPIIDSLKSIGLDVVFSSRSDIILHSAKISGNAMHIYKNRVLAHGTLLFDANIQHLSNSLHNNLTLFTDKSIKSVKSKVSNISNFLIEGKTMKSFTGNIFQNVLKNTPGSYIKSLDDTEKSKIMELSLEKFETWKWIFGYSPRYTFENEFTFYNSLFKIKISVEKGIIYEINLSCSDSNSGFIKSAVSDLINCRHYYDDIFQSLANNDELNSKSNFNISEFCYKLFQ